MYSGCTDAEGCGDLRRLADEPLRSGDVRLEMGDARWNPACASNAREARLPRAIQIARRLPKASRRGILTWPRFARGRRCSPARLGLPPPVRDLFVYLTERWDGKGLARPCKGEDSAAIRIVHIARDAAFQRMLGGEAFAVRVVRERAGHAFDPHVAACLADGAAEILALDHEASAWDDMLACEPHPQLTLEGEAIDRALAAIGESPI